MAEKPSPEDEERGHHEQEENDEPQKAKAGCGTQQSVVGERGGKKGQCKHMCVVAR